jgi:hypothetical protein
MKGSSMHGQYTAFELDKLNKGKLLEEINHDMIALQHAMAEYAQRYGAEAEKAKAVLTVKIAIICQDPATHQFAVKVESSSTLPKRPCDIAVAFIDKDEDSGESEMVVRTFAERKDPGPKLPFERVDPQTGEVIQGDKPAPAGGK